MEQRPSEHLDVVAIEKGAFGQPSTKVANFTTYIIYTWSLKLKDSIRSLRLQEEAL